MRSISAFVALVAAGALTAGCGDVPPADEASSLALSPGSTTSAPVPLDDPAQEGAMRIQITIDDERFGATLAESAAALDLLAQLPTTVEMVDHGGVEKTGPLASPLSLDGQPDGADPDVGDLGYYAPGNDLVLYYGDQSYFRGIVVLGRLDAHAAGRIAELHGPVTARVEATDG